MTTYYKVLKHGRSFEGGKQTWSLPKDGKPGEWHKIPDSLTLERHLVGYHLTSEPTYKRDIKKPSIQCYEAEVDGEYLEGGTRERDVIIARRVRLLRHVPWHEMMGEGDGIITEDETLYSPAYKLLSHVWENEGCGKVRSWSRLNDSMWSAICLAVKSLMSFDIDDFTVFQNKFQSGYWLSDGEGIYSLSCDNTHGQNMSACLSFENWKGRKPFLVMRAPGEPKIRLAVGSRFVWWKGKLEPGKADKVHVKVTSFDDKAQTVTACSYKPKSGKPGDYPPDKIDKRFTITHDAIAAYHAMIPTRRALIRDTKEKDNE